MTVYKPIKINPSTSHTISKSPVLFNRYQIFLIGIFSNCFFSSILLSINYASLGQPKKMLGVFIFGIIATFRTSIFFYGFQDFEWILFWVFQVICSYGIAFPIWDKTIDRDIKYVSTSNFTTIAFGLLAIYLTYFDDFKIHWKIIAFIYNIFF